MREGRVSGLLDRLLIPTACVLCLIAAGTAARGQAGLGVIHAMPHAFQQTLFRLWWQSQPDPPNAGLLRSAHTVLVVDVTDPAQPEALKLSRLREDVLGSSLKKGDTVAWQHVDFPMDPRCNSKLPRTNAGTRGCEVAAARRLVRGPERRRAFDDWLSQGEWLKDPEAIRFEVAMLTGTDNFAEIVPELMRGVRKDLERAQRLGIKSGPVVMINGKEMDSDDPDWVLCAIEMARSER